MHSVNAREARKIFSELLTETERGEIVFITRRGQEVARLVPPEMAEPMGLPSMKEFRASIKVKGKATSELVSQMRDEERF